MEKKYELLPEGQKNLVKLDATQDQSLEVTPYSGCIVNNTKKG
jgi:hypothetical protein